MLLAFGEFFMKDIRGIVAKNICELRQLNNMTQLELAEKLNYSDKAISKWERAESCPDISVLVQISELFGVTVDYLVKEDNKERAVNNSTSEETRYNRRAIAYISESCAWMVAIVAFIITTLILKRITFQFLYFAYALPVAMIVKLVFNSVWFNPRHNYLIISILMWSLLSAIHITFMCSGIDIALIYLLGVAGQIIIVLWSFISKPKSKQ